jgi:NAD(P)H-hydrate epimerase
MRDCEARYSARSQDQLVRAAGTAVALEAKRLLGSCYGARVAVLVGPGFNGADGRVAGQWLSYRGAHVTLIEVKSQPNVLAGFDLVIDAAFGIGCSRPYEAPKVDAGTLVLAVDVPSGVDADTGELFGSPMKADVTVALGAYKYAHVTGPAQDFAGALRFVDLDLVDDFRDGVLEDSDLLQLGTSRRDDHKWKHALSVFAGSPLMSGAAELVSRGALAAGASMIRLQSHGELVTSGSFPPEVVHSEGATLDARSHAVVAGPGLGSDIVAWLCERLADVHVPVVLDADALQRELIEVLSARTSLVLTPHEGEYERLLGAPVAANRIDAVRRASVELGAVVLLKGPATVIADPSGDVRIVVAGTPALATAGSGDVLSGLIGATLARGHDPLAAASLAAHLHARAGARLSTYAPASSIPGEVTRVLDDLRRARALPSL